MRLDKAATKHARRRHAAGVLRLNKVFGASAALLAASGLQHGNARPVRLRPGVPPVRDAEHQEKHRRRKRARVSRRRNRK